MPATRFPIHNPLDSNRFHCEHNQGMSADRKSWVK